MNHDNPDFPLDVDLMRRSLVASLLQFKEQAVADGDDVLLRLVSGEDEFQLLQQRFASGRHHKAIGHFQEVACLAISTDKGERTVILFSAIKEADKEEWEVIQSTTSVFSSNVPYRLFTLVGFHRVVIGLIAISPEVQGIRLTMPDGSQLEDKTSNGSALLFRHFDLSKQNSEMGILEILDGKAMTTGSTAVRVLSRGDQLTT